MPSCVDASGYKEAERIRYGAVSTASAIKQTVLVAQFALNAQDAYQQFKKLSDISSRGIAIEEQQHDRLKSVYWPAESQMLAEFTQPQAWETQAVLARRYRGQLRATLAQAFAKKIGEAQCNKPRYCGTAYGRSMQELLAARAAAYANADALADKFAFAEVEAVRDTDFSRRQQVIGLFQGLIGQAAALLSSASGSFADAANDAMGSANSALQALGYERNRVVDGTPFHAQAAQVASQQMATWGQTGDTVVDPVAAMSYPVTPTSETETGWTVTDLPATSSSDRAVMQPETGVNGSNDEDRARTGKITISGLKADGSFGTSVVRTFTIDISKLPLANVAPIFTKSTEQEIGSGSDGPVSYS